LAAILNQLCLSEKWAAGTLVTVDGLWLTRSRNTGTPAQR
jgi:hypothetical protein